MIMKVCKLLNSNLAGKDFHLLLDLCFESSSYFTLKNNCFSSIKDQDGLLSELKPHLKKQLKFDYWHGYPKNLNSNYSFDIYVYLNNLESKNILKDNFDNLFFDTYDYSKGKHNKKPEDLCFFRESSRNKELEILLGTLSHESLCHVYLNSDTHFILDRLCEFSLWEETNSFDKNFISLSI